MIWSLAETGNIWGRNIINYCLATLSGHWLIVFDKIWTQLSIRLNNLTNLFLRFSSFGRLSLWIQSYVAHNSLRLDVWPLFGQTCFNLLTSASNINRFTVVIKNVWSPNTFRFAKATKTDRKEWSHSVTGYCRRRWLRFVLGEPMEASNYIDTIEGKNAGKLSVYYLSNILPK